MSVNLIIDDITEFISNGLTLYAALEADVFHSGDGDALMVRNVPTEAEQGIDFEGDRFGGYAFELWARSKDDVKAKSQLIEIERLFGFERQMELTDYLSIQVKRVATATIAEQTEAKEFIYVSQLEIEYLAQGGY